MWIIDRKTGAEQPGADGPQTAAYAYLHEHGIEIALDEGRHVYTLDDGSHPPSVTQILKAAGLYKGEDYFTEEKTLLGSIVHQYCEFYDLGTLDETEIDPAVDGYLESWRKFRAALGFIPVKIERPMYSPVYRFAGKSDVIGTMGEDAPTFGLWNQRRGCCYLQADGSLAQWKPHTKRTDWDVFLATLTLWNHKKEAGL